MYCGKCRRTLTLHVHRPRLKPTETGGFYIDLAKVLKPLTAEQFRKLLRDVDGSVDLYTRAPSQKDSFKVSDIILSQYRKKK